ncbi:MAG: four helix bundle protein [Calditrichia bacterium]
MEEILYKLDDFELYKQAREFRKRVYSVIKQLPPEEKYALDPQMRKAAISVTNNIAEGHGRWHFQENIQFCRISRGSIEEIIDDINTCIDEGYCKEIKFNELKDEAYNLIKQINSYLAYLKSKKSELNR